MLTFIVDFIAIEIKLNMFANNVFLNISTHLSKSDYVGFQGLFIHLLKHFWKVKYNIFIR